MLNLAISGAFSTFKIISGYFSSFRVLRLFWTIKWFRGDFFGHFLLLGVFWRFWEYNGLCSVS